MKASVSRNGWFGLGARVNISPGDYVYVVLRFAVWQIWLSWEAREKESDAER